MGGIAEDTPLAGHAPTALAPVAPAARRAAAGAVAEGVENVDAATSSQRRLDYGCGDDVPFSQRYLLTGTDDESDEDEKEKQNTFHDNHHIRDTKYFPVFQLQEDCR